MGFKECEAVDTKGLELTFQDPDIEGLTKFLVETCSFSQDRVLRYMDRLKNAKSRTKQRPLDSFFGRAKVTIKDDEKFDPLKKKAGAKGGAKAGTKAGAKAGAKRPTPAGPSGGAKRARI